MNQTKRKLVYWLPVILWMLLIFFLSSQPASESNNLSTGVTELIIKSIGKLLPLDIETSTIINTVSKLNHYVRKSAHFISYLILGVLVLNAFIKCKIEKKKAIIYSIIICVFYSISDEVHQLFVPGRGGQLKDVVIDSCGTLVGIIIYSLINYNVLSHNSK